MTLLAYPLRVCEGALWFGSRARFTPDGLAVWPMRRPARTLPWADAGRPSGTGWYLGMTDATPRRAVRFADGVAMLPLSFALMDYRIDEVRCLCAYLRDTPAARPGLADPVRVTALARAMRHGHWWSTHLPHSLSFDPYGLHWSVSRALDEMWPRRYDGRPVAGEPLPDLDDVVRHVRAEQPGRFTDDEIAERVRPYLAVAPWPFSILLAETNVPRAR